jgi:CRISPR/Cas system-associated endonuclease Cas1
MGKKALRTITGNHKRIWNGWRTVVAGSGGNLSLCDGCLVVRGEEERTIPLLQLRELIVERPRGNISLPLLAVLSRNHISLLICDEKPSPVGVYNHPVHVQSNTDSPWLP